MKKTLEDVIDLASLKGYIKRICETCKKCQLNKQSVIKHGQIQGHISGNDVFDKLSSDILGPFNVSDFNINLSGKRFWLLTITDTFSKYTQVKVLRGLDAKILERKFKKGWIKRFGCFNKLITDQGKCYISKSFKEFLRQNNIRHIINTAYNPQGSGISERINREIMLVIRINKHKNFKKILKIIHNRLNNTWHRTINQIPSVIINKTHPLDPEKHQILVNKETLANNIQLNNIRNNSKVNVGRKPHMFKVGDLILIKNENKNKLASKYRGPYKIVEISQNENSLMVMNDSKPERVNLKRIKIYLKRGKM